MGGEGSGLKQQTQHAIVERIPRWLASVAISLFVGLLVISFFTGRKITWSPLGFDPPSTTVSVAPGADVPFGAVVAFNAEVCPDGWEEFEKAYGRFVRGIDKSGGRVDPDGQRLPGVLQEDTFESHQHAERPAAGTNWYTLYDRTQGSWPNEKEGNSSPSDATQTGATGDSETRPKNVALLYCQKFTDDE